VDECFLYSAASITADVQEHDKMNTTFGKDNNKSKLHSQKMTSRKLESSATLLREPQISQIKTY
jgi:hypothetical protein